MERASSLVLPEAEEAGPPARVIVRYEDDAHAWALEQAALLKEGRFADLDLPNLADEVEDVANREYDKLESNLARVIQHLLKWDHQRNHRSRSWVNSIREHRRRAARQLDKFPSLDGRRTEALAEAYEHGGGDAAIETGLPDDVLPETNPFSWDEVMTRPRRLARAVTSELRLVLGHCRHHPIKAP